MIISDGIGKTVRNLVLTVACDNYRSMIKGKLKNQQKVVFNQTFVVPSIKHINNMGQVTIAFSDTMKPVNYTNITKGIFKAYDVAWPALEIKMKPYDEEKTINFTWRCTNYTAN